MVSIMKLKIKRFDQSLPLPEYKTNRAAALDLYARVEVRIESKKVDYIPLNIALELPKNYWALLAARSSLHKKGLMLANGIGIGDEDYCGDNDEYLAAVFNFTDEAIVVKKGERIVQLMILPREKVKIEEIKKLENQNRGGLGSTGF